MEKLITSVHESARFVDRPVDKKIVGFSFLDSVAGPSARLSKSLTHFRKGGRDWDRTEDSYGEATHRSRR